MYRKKINNKFVIDNIIFLSYDKCNNYANSKKVGVKNITIALLYDLLYDDYFYGYILDLFNEKIEYLSVVYIDFYGVEKIEKYYKIDILKALSSTIVDNTLVINSKIEERFKKIMENIGYEAFKNKYIDENYECMIDDNKVVVPVSLIIAFLECSEEEYNKFFDLKNNNNIIGIPKEYFIYSLIRFFRSNDIFNKYYIPENLYKRYRNLLDSRKIDFQSLNKINETHNINSKNIVLNIELENEVLKNIPKNLNKLEKAIYIYLKLCDLLTYDEEFFSLSSEGNINKKHENIKRLETISLENNKVICYEFNAIYSKLLERILVNYETNASYLGTFGGGHEDLTFKCGKYLVKADSTITTIIYSDIVNVKLGKKLNGIVCLNVNQNTQEEFKKILNKTYELFNGMKIKNSNNINFRNLELKYKNIRENNDVLLFQKFNYLVKEITENNLVGVDAISYSYQLIKLIFNNEEILNNINFTMVRSNFKKYGLCAIFTINDEYYFYIPKYTFEKISKEMIEILFNFNCLQYIDQKHKIPGINIEKNVMKLTKKQS